MKIILEYRDRKTIIIGSDYETIINKIRLLFPDENDSTILFYDYELKDYFDFTSFDQIQDQPNGVKMTFNSSRKLNDVAADSSPSIPHSDEKQKENNYVKKPRPRRNQKKKENEDNSEIDEPIVLPKYCVLIQQGLQSRALIEAYPTLNYLNKDVDGKKGRAPHHTISQLLSKKKRNIKYYKNHPTAKRSKLSEIEPDTNVEAFGQLTVEKPQTKQCKNETIIVSGDSNTSITTSSNSNNLFIESRTTGPLVSPSNIIQQSFPRATTTSNESSLSLKSSRRATISLIPPISTKLVNVSTINTTPVPNKLPLTTTSTNSFLYHDGRMLLTSVQAQPVVAVHKALVPRAAKKISNIMPATINNTTSPATSNDTTSPAAPNHTTSFSTSNNIIPLATINRESNHTLAISNDNVDECVTLSNEESMLHLKISKSEQDAYDKDINRLRSIIQAKGKASQNISITEINALLRSTHKLRRQILLEKKDVEFSLKVVQHQEIFHQEALIYEYSLIKKKLFSYEKLEHEARALLDTHIRKYSISNEHSLTERDFQTIQNLCSDLNESNIFFKNGLSNSHPPIGVLMMPSINSNVEKAFMFIKNLPYKMHVRVGIAGLHKILALFVIVYMNLNHWPTHKLLLMLIEHSKENSN
ncbi:unnamed protein product [Rotaria sp. Silwood1]|nr:unnamed protein product [Rotaria sp. Silwood1]CAF1643386.1 unnamed protein product [Rotaria sp. Silwood1]CAF3825129.1 unnamed protein product [Rotaria sp. Silwood1]CAF3934186.1 unnamed protein product [Rotaria sp. Silwood1]